MTNIQEALNDQDLDAVADKIYRLSPDGQALLKQTGISNPAHLNNILESKERLELQIAACIGRLNFLMTCRSLAAQWAENRDERDDLATRLYRSAFDKLEKGFALISGEAFSSRFEELFPSVIESTIQKMGAALNEIFEAKPLPGLEGVDFVDLMLTESRKEIDGKLEQFKAEIKEEQRFHQLAFDLLKVENSELFNPDKKAAAAFDNYDDAVSFFEKTFGCHEEAFTAEKAVAKIEGVVDNMLHILIKKIRSELG